GIRAFHVTGVQTCALPISRISRPAPSWATPTPATSCSAWSSKRPRAAPGTRRSSAGSWNRSAWTTPTCRTAPPGLRSPHANAYQVFPSGERVDVTEVIVADSGGYVSTTADVNRFFQALLGGELLPRERLAEMRDTVPVD